MSAAPLRPVVDLGVAEAYSILMARPEGEGLPPLDAIENEDWGRDLLLSRFETIPGDELTAMGLVWEGEADKGRGRSSDQSG